MWVSDNKNVTDKLNVSPNELQTELSPAVTRTFRRDKGGESARSIDKSWLSKNRYQFTLEILICFWEISFRIADPTAVQTSRVYFTNCVRALILSDGLGSVHVALRSCSFRKQPWRGPVLLPSFYSFFVPRLVIHRAQKVSRTFFFSTFSLWFIARTIGSDSFLLYLESVCPQESEQNSSVPVWIELVMNSLKSNG